MGRHPLAQYIYLTSYKHIMKKGKLKLKLKLILTLTHKLTIKNII